MRFCCSVKPSQLWWGLPHPHHQLDFPHYPSKIANTLASPRKRGGGLTASQNRYSASSSFCNLPDCFQNYYTFCRQDGGDCFPLAQSLRCYPLTFKRVRFCCSVKPSQLWWGLLHIRTINEIYRTIPRKPPTPLPPLSKGGGLTARHKPLYFCFLLVPRPPFLFTKPFCRQDGGIASPLCFAPHSYRPLSKVRCCRRKNSGDYRRDCHTYRTLSASLTPPLTIPHSVPNPRKTAPSHSLFVLRVRQPHFPEK